MEKKYLITFTTFKKYCKHKTSNTTWALCGKTEGPNVRTEFCEKKVCPLFKRLTIIHDL